MAKADYKNNILGASGQFKVIVPAATTGSQIIGPLGNLMGSLPADGTLNGTGTATALPMRVSRILVATGGGIVSLYDANATVVAASTNLLFSKTTAAAGDIYVTDVMCVNGAWVVTGAGTQVTAIFD